MAADVPDVRSPRDALAGILRAALAGPGSLTPACLDALSHALRLAPDACELALCGLAAVLYARPDLVEDPLLDRLADLVTAEAPLPGGAGSALATLFAFLASSPKAPKAWTRLAGMLRDERLCAGLRESLVPLVRDFVQWRPDLVGLDGVLALAQSPALADHRAFLLDYGIEPFVFSAPEAFTQERLERVEAVFQDAPRYRYVLYSLAARRGLGVDERAWCAGRLAGRFPLHESGAAILKARPFRLVVVVNLGMGQGDDLVRLAPLLQALLDGNPALAITLVTRRTYLYDNPRVAPVPIGDDAAVGAALREPLDGVVELFQADWIEFAFRPELHPAIERVLAERRPPFVVKAEFGRAHRDNRGVRPHFLYRTVGLGGRDIARSLGLDWRRAENIYEPCFRLIAELGLPQRAGQDSPLTPSLLTGTRSIDAERVWADLVSPGRTEAPQPVALVNPFGGSLPTKGFLEQGALLAAEIEGLIDEGYLVVLLPTGTAWGGPGAIADALAGLGAERRAHVRPAPDPARPDEAVRLGLLERPELASADRVVRLFKYFATYADLVVTVEGWMAHLAYCLGRPLRLFLAAGSFGPSWHPYGRGRDQRLVTTLSPRSRARHSDTGLLRDGDPPPFPHRPRKALLELALAGLGRAGGPEAVALLRRARASRDSEVRTWAVAALGRISPIESAKPDLLAALEDREPIAVAAAAEALLRAGADCSRELGPRYREQLGACVDIARHDWDAVARVGAAALPALFRAATSENYLVCRGARLMLREMLAPYVPRLPPESPARC